MQEGHPTWIHWARHLENWGLRDFCAWALEAAGPVSLVGAHLVYLTQPFLSFLVKDSTLLEIAGLLESSEDTRAFVRYLRKDTDAAHA